MKVFPLDSDIECSPQQPLKQKRTRQVAQTATASAFRTVSSSTAIWQVHVLTTCKPLQGWRYRTRAAANWSGKSRRLGRLRCGIMTHAQPSRCIEHPDDVVSSLFKPEGQQSTLICVYCRRGTAGRAAEQRQEAEDGCCQSCTTGAACTRAAEWQQRAAAPQRQAPGSRQRRGCRWRGSQRLLHANCPEEEKGRRHASDVHPAHLACPGRALHVFLAQIWSHRN